MITWRLWLALNTPTPLAAAYRRLYLRRDAVEPVPAKPRALNWFTAAFFMLLPVVVIFFGATFLFTALTSLVQDAFLAISLAVTLYGLAHCTVVSGQIGREHDAGTYDTLGASLPGLLGLHWTYAARWLLAQRLLRWLLLGLVATSMFAVLLGLSQILPGSAAINTHQHSLHPAKLVALLLLWLDYAQSIILSSMVAMLAPVYAPQETNARLAAASAFLSMQVLLALILNFFNIQLARLIFGALSPTLEQQMIYSVAALLFAFTLRETIIRLLWIHLVRTLNATPSELDALTRSGL